MMRFEWEFQGATPDSTLIRKPNFTGKRGRKIKGKLNNLGRGGYLTDDGIWINSDCNGAANLLRKKAITQLEDVSLAKVTRGVLSRPHRYNVFSDLSKLYRKKCEETVLQPVSSLPFRIHALLRHGELNYLQY